MCRLLGFRSVIPSQVHRSLVSAENALGVQSEHHPDGWGVAYYVGGSPHLLRSASTAIVDHLFHRVSGIVSSETVVAHVRRATQGTLSTLNSHPFQFGRWIFAHNGNLKDFGEHRPALLQRVPPALRRFILGETDSELLFHMLLGALERRGALHTTHAGDADPALDDVVDAARETIDEVVRICGPWSWDADGAPTETYLTFVLTNGRLLLGHQGGKSLHWSTWKHRCGERETCPSYGPSCEAAVPPNTDGAFINHLLLSSEPLQGENVWTAMQPGEIVAVDGRMRLHRYAPAYLGAGI